MLQQFTWQQFLIAALIFIFIWYVVIVLLFYRKELYDFLTSRKLEDRIIEPLPHRWESNVEKLIDPIENDLLGKTKMPEGINPVSTGDFSFAGARVEDDKVGLVPDVLEEIKQIFLMLIKSDGNKTDFFRAIEKVKNDYPKIGSNPNLSKINEFIVDHAPFHLSAEELENIWY